MKIQIDTHLTTTGQVLWVVNTGNAITRDPELMKALDQQENLTYEAKLHLLYEVERSLIRPEFIYSVPDAKKKEETHA